MPIEQLGHGAAELLSLTSGGEARSLNKLTELAARQVPSCSGAHAAVWRDGEVASAAATHPDLAELADLQLRSGSGPLVEAAEDRVHGRQAGLACPQGAFHTIECALLASGQAHWTLTSSPRFQSRSDRSCGTVAYPRLQRANGRAGEGIGPHTAGSR